MFASNDHSSGIWILQFEKESEYVYYTYERNEQGIFKIQDAGRYSKDTKRSEASPY